MKFTHVTIQNFLSYGSPSQRVDLDNRGLVAVLGRNADSQGADSNGAGKSTIMESIVWALYGETMRGYRGDAVVNRSVGSDCFVELVLEDSGTSYEIRRTRKASAKKPNDIQLTVNGTDATQGTNADTQALIQTIVGMDVKTFTQSVMMWHGTRPFSQMSDREQKAVLEDILQIEKFSKAREVVKKRLSESRQAVAEVVAALNVNHATVSDTEIRLSKLLAQKASHAVIIDQKRRQLFRKKVDCEAKIEEIYTNTGLDKLLDLQEDLKAKEEALGKRRSHVQTQRLEVTRNYSAKRSNLSRLEGTAQGQIQQLQHSIETFDTLVGKPCPTCKQVLTVEVAEADVAVWEGQINKLRSETLVRASKKRADLDAAERAELDSLASEEGSIGAEWSTLSAQIRTTSEAVRKRQASLSLICQLEQQAWNFQQEIEQLAQESDPYGSLIDDAEAQLERLQKDLKVLQYREKSLAIEIQHLEYWDHGFGNQGIKSYLMDNVIPFLTEQAQLYADIISGGDIKIEFSTQTQLASGEWRDRFQVKAFNEQGADVYHGNSDGERRRIDIAVGWALADLAAARSQKSIKFRGLDEPFENLDETGEDLVIKLLHQVLDRYETVLCVTHSTHLRDQFPEEILVTFENGYSTIS